MASHVDICNMALGHIGAATRVASITPPDGSVEADRCAMFYPVALRAFIEIAEPSWARKRVTLTENATNESDVWLYSYAKPNDCVKPLRVLRVGDVERLSADYEQEGDNILTDEPEAVLLYLWARDDPTRLTPIGTIAVSYLLAGLLAGGTVKGRPGTQVAKAFTDMGVSYALKAAASDGNASSSTAEFTPSSIAARR
jgi:hypothetical protein